MRDKDQCFGDGLAGDLDTMFSFRGLQGYPVKELFGDF